MGLFKRGNIWWMSFMYQGKQVRRSAGTAQRRLAEAIFGKVKANIVEGRYFDVLEEQDRTFGELMERYTKERVSKSVPTSARRVQSILAHVLPCFGEKTLAEMTPPLIAAYKTRRREEGAAPATINKELGLMKAAFNLATREWEWCRDNPVRRVAMERVNNARVRYLGEEDFERLLRACPDWLKPIALVARYTGLRRANIVTLRWEQVDLPRKVMLLDRTKNGDRLGLPLCERLVQVFKGLSRVRHLHSPYAFTRASGQPYSGDMVRIAFIRVCRKVGITDFRFHDLRHTFASSLVQRGVDLYRVQRLLGHRDGRMTQRYAHLAPENLREAIRVMDEDYHTFSTMNAPDTRTGERNG